jgi:toxin-antitoxin system PIN domain toxin
LTLIDANLVLYAFDLSSPHHRAAHRWLSATLSSPEPLALPWATILAFLRLSTDPRLLRRPLTIAEASATVSEWLALPNVSVPSPGDRHWAILSRLLTEGQVRGALVTDAHLAALAIEHGATIATVDRDFARFPGLRFFNPLLSSSEGR